MTQRICFVCLGNIVRSPLAENLFQKLANEANLDHRYDVDSAGTSDWHVGERPDTRMRQVAREKGLEYSGRARQFTARDLDHFDLVIAMDQQNAQDLAQLARNPAQVSKIRLMREFDPQAGGEKDVPDPYYSGIDGFERVYQIIERSVLGLIEALENGTKDLGDR